ncbi:hypothetical protein BB561_001814 [Smittium simulii]|uniref:Uncharacterized protein n=1 Tax=Smittium simulii TaxID=133385 RepID=A0A2T9YSZ4_9FUNG|nr:hypothetical protein BB561_001814 [Smittium simulii]
MGNAHGKRSEILFDGGYFVPQDIYPTADQDFDFKIVEKLIRERKLSPFYKGASDPDEETPPASVSSKKVETYETCEGNNKVDSKELPLSQSRIYSKGDTFSPKNTPSSNKLKTPQTLSPMINSSQPVETEFQRLKINTNNPPASVKYKFPDYAKTPSPSSKNSADFDSPLYPNILKKTIECPICFLYYPQNINYTVCCSKPICTECFAQFKRTEKHITPVEERYGKSVSHSISSASMFHNPSNHKRSFSDTPFSITSNAISADDIRPKILQKIEREKARKAERIHQREMIIASVARIADQYTTHNSSGTDAREAMQNNEQGRQLLRDFRSRGGTSLEEFLVQEAIALSHQEANRQPLSLLTDTQNTGNPNDASPSLRNESDIPPNLEASPLN